MKPLSLLLMFWAGCSAHAATHLVCTAGGEHGAHTEPGHAMMRSEIRLVPGTFARIEEAWEMGERYPTFIRRFPLKAVHSTEKWPIGTHLGVSLIKGGGVLPSSRLSDVVVLTITGKTLHEGESFYVGVYSRMKTEETSAEAVRCKLAR